MYRCSLVSNSNSWITVISVFQNPRLTQKQIWKRHCFMHIDYWAKLYFWGKFSTSFAHTIWNLHRHQCDINIHLNIPIKVTEIARMVQNFSSKLKPLTAILLYKNRWTQVRQPYWWRFWTWRTSRPSLWLQLQSPESVKMLRLVHLYYKVFADYISGTIHK